MPSIRPAQDIRPLSAFRANAAALIRQARETRRPIVLTQHGRGTAVVLDVDAYEALLEEVETLRDVRAAEAELDAGGGRPHEDALAAVRERLRG